MTFKIIKNTIIDENLNDYEFILLNSLYNLGCNNTDFISLNTQQAIKFINFSLNTYKKHLELLADKGYISKSKDSLYSKNTNVKILYKIADTITSHQDIFDKLKYNTRTFRLYFVIKFFNDNNLYELNQSIIKKYLKTNGSTISLSVKDLVGLGLLDFIKPSNNFEKHYYKVRETLSKNLYTYDITKNHEFGKTKSKINNKAYDLDEVDIETSIIKYLNKLNPNLNYIDRQVKIDDKIIDILCTNNITNENVIIEVKNFNDYERLCFQALYYPTLINNSKMIVLNSSYSKSLLVALKKIKDIELYQYKLTLDNDKNITDIKFIKR